MVSCAIKFAPVRAGGVVRPPPAARRPPPATAAATTTAVSTAAAATAAPRHAKQEKVARLEAAAAAAARRRSQDALGAAARIGRRREQLLSLLFGGRENHQPSGRSYPSVAADAEKKRRPGRGIQAKVPRGGGLRPRADTPLAPLGIATTRAATAEAADATDAEERRAFVEAAESMRGVQATVTSCIGGRDEKFAVQVRPAAPRPQYFVYKTLGDFDALWSSLEAMAADVKRRQRQMEDARFGAGGASDSSRDRSRSASLRGDGKPQSLSLMAKWLASVVDHFAFRRAVEELRAQDKEAMSALNVFLHFLVPRVSALYVENTLLRCGCCRVTRQLAKLVHNFLEVEAAPGSPQSTAAAARARQPRKRQFAEMRPEDCDRSSSSTVDSALSGRDSADSCKRANTGAPLFPDRRSASPVGGLAPPRLGLPPVHSGELEPIGMAAMSIGVGVGGGGGGGGGLGVAPLPGRRRVFAEVDF